MQKLRDVRPLVPVDFVGVEYDPFFLVVYRRLFDAGVQMVVPSLPALLSGSAPDVVFVCQLLGNECPSLGSIFGHQVNDGVILLK